MNIYSKKQRWKWLLSVIAIIIIITSLWYTKSLVKRIAEDERAKVKLWAKAVKKKAKLLKFTNELFTKMKLEERKKVELYAEATRQLTAGDMINDFALKVIQDNTTVPVILTDESGEITGKRNLDSLQENDTTYLRRQLNIMKESYAPVTIKVYKQHVNFL